MQKLEEVEEAIPLSYAMVNHSKNIIRNFRKNLENKSFF